MAIVIESPSARSYRESRPYGRGVDEHAARAPHEVELEVHQRGVAVLVRLRPHADQAVAQTPLQRAERLPLEAIERIAGRMRLRDDAAGQPAAPVVVVAVAAGQVELALAPLPERAAGVEERLRARVGRDL